MTITTDGKTTADKPAPAPRTLSDLRKATGLGVAQLAERMGVHRTRVTAIEARYPNVNYETLVRYIGALGGSIQFTVGSTHVYADQLAPDPEKRGTRHYMESRPGMGNLVYAPASAAEKLPLQSGTPEPGDDDTSGQIDHADTESDQGHGDQGEQP
jgi:transcriptional regulator with XRE-family HTH domain